MAENKKTQRLEAAAAEVAAKLRSNGTSKVLWWIMGLVAALMVAAFSGWITSVNESGHRTIRMEQKMEDFDKRLERIETKIDKLSGGK